MEAAGHSLAWQRDPVESYEFHVTVPTGVNTLDVSLDAITSLDSAGAGGPAASSNVLDLNWNAVVLYPKGARSDDVNFEPSVTLPAGWKFGTALQVARTLPATTWSSHRLTHDARRFASDRRSSLPQD
jgi:predicted metalloprotease with PDZ domain